MREQLLSEQHCRHTKPHARQRISAVMNVRQPLKLRPYGRIHMCIIVTDEQEIICGVDYSFNCRNVQIVRSHVRRKEVVISEK